MSDPVSARPWPDRWMTDWTARELEADLSFLSHGKFEVEIFEDGANASRYGSEIVLRKLIMSQIALELAQNLGIDYIMHPQKNCTTI